MTFGEESVERVGLMRVFVSVKENREGMVRQVVGDVSMTVITAVEMRVDIEKCMLHEMTLATRYRSIHRRVLEVVRKAFTLLKSAGGCISDMRSCVESHFASVFQDIRVEERDNKSIVEHFRIQN